MHPIAGLIFVNLPFFIYLHEKDLQIRREMLLAMCLDDKHVYHHCSAFCTQRQGSEYEVQPNTERLRWWISALLGPPRGRRRRTYAREAPKAHLRPTQEAPSRENYVRTT